jgi:signal transducing adaptor molecule
VQEEEDKKKKTFGGIKMFPDVQPGQQKALSPRKEEEAKKKTEEQEVMKMVAMYDYEATEEGELTFKQGDAITVLEQFENGWWSGELRGQAGVFPVNFTKPANA